MNLRQLTAAATGVLAALALTACGSDSKSDSTVPADVDLTVYAGPGIKFDQTAYTLAAGDSTVAFINRDAQKHTLDILDESNTTIGEQLVVGKTGDTDTGSYQLAAGTYEIRCLVPGHDAMKATLTVTAG